MNWPEDFNLPQEHCSDVLNGCYEAPVNPSVILDIGANVGAFARWAYLRFPDAKIYCYEPHPGNFALLTKSKTYYNLDKVELRQVAVADKSDVLTLYENGFNCGEWSLIKFDEHGTGRIDVQVIDAADLPEADFIKIDTEGVEPNIVKRLADLGRLDKVQGVVLEYHAATHVAPLIWMLQEKGLRLYHLAAHGDHRGVMRFIR